MNEDKLLTAQAEDLIKRCERRDIPVCSGFLDARQQSLLRRHFGTKQADVSIVYYGGHKDADRVVMACFPYYMSDQICMEDRTEKEAAFDMFLSVIRASVPRNSAASGKRRALSHSDYLGALMGLGISRSVIGDIIVTDDGADIIVLKEMAEYLIQNLSSAGKASIATREISFSELRIPATEQAVFTDTVASVRLDAVLAVAFRISRGKAAQAIGQGHVFVDHLEATRPDMNVDEGAELVIRHMGKAKLQEIGKRTRKNRISITIAKYK